MPWILDLALMMWFFKASGKMLKAICYLLEMCVHSVEVTETWRCLKIWFQYVEIIPNLQIPSPSPDPRLSLLQCQASSAQLKGVSSFCSFSASCSSNNLSFHLLPMFCCFLLFPLFLFDPSHSNFWAPSSCTCCTLRASWAGQVCETLTFAFVCLLRCQVWNIAFPCMFLRVGNPQVYFDPI